MKTKFKSANNSSQKSQNFFRNITSNIVLILSGLLIIVSVLHREFEKSNFSFTSSGTSSDVVSEIEFRNSKSLEEHFKKHGIEMGYSSAYEYQERANEIISDDDVLKTQQDDSDMAYFLQSTNEFVVVSRDGFFRTFFIPEDGIKYFNKQ